MRNYSERCHFVFETEQGTHWFPCSLGKNHDGRHLDGYDRTRDPEKEWYERISYEAQYEELYERVLAAKLDILLEGLVP